LSPSDFLFPWITCGIFSVLGFGLLPVLLSVREYAHLLQIFRAPAHLFIWSLFGIPIYLIIVIFFFIVRCSPYYRQPFEKYLPQSSAVEKTTQAAE
jgi:hypothetical protein